MAEDAIRVAGAFLDQLYGSISKVSRDLGAGASVPRSDFSRAPQVQQSWEALYSRWDESQRAVSENLDKLAVAVRGIRDAFEQCDAQLAGSLAAGQ